MLVSRTENHSIDGQIFLPADFEKGQVFTPRFLASWAGLLLAERLGADWKGSILDPACGDGELLDAALEYLPNAKLLGFDIDIDATSAAKMRLGSRAEIETKDMLLARSKSHKKPLIDAIISNPPWGADLLHSSSQLRSFGYSLANGQYDSWSLFVEMSLERLRQDGLAVFILPDAIFAPEHAATRRLVTHGSSIELIARLGEGIFKGVFRGTTVLLVRKTLPSADHKTQVFRLSKEHRAAVLADKLDLQEVRALEAHYVPQERFLADHACRWDIDVRATEASILGKIEALGGDWTDALVSGRGVELSKRGAVKVCNACGYSVPAPTRPRDVICRGCGQTSASEEMSTQKIVYSNDVTSNGCMPLVVGEDIGRYSLSCTRQIKLNVRGINYKDHSTYSTERLLVRKTGVGLKATVTKIFAASNQVVFHYTLKNSGCDFFLHYALGVLSSRVMFAYHLRKSGENEWRSHPYVTPKSLKELPIPVPVRSSQMWRQAKAIAKLAKSHLKGGGKCKKIDMEIECLVAGLYQLETSEVLWVREVINSAQDLEPMRALRDFEIEYLSPIMVP